jgi:hypothetical protein
MMMMIIIMIMIMIMIYISCTLASPSIRMELYKMISVGLTHEFAAMKSSACKKADSAYVNVNIPAYIVIDFLTNLDASF